ncbi:MAG TPA: cation:dicarboxylase symporter family transporter [Thermoanaerobaculia bacterium]|nr:cation:dicarboxylase symporter family transporter [Thermoanaerobaculia bacterium]
MVPLVVSALVLGVAGLGDLRSLARIGWRTLVLTAAVSLVAVVLGVGMVELFQPGRGMAPERVAALSEGAAERAAGITGGAAPKTGLELLVGIVPSNVVKAAADGDLLALMFFAALFGVGMLLTGGDAAQPAGAGGGGGVRGVDAADRPRAAPGSPRGGRPAVHPHRRRTCTRERSCQEGW